MTGDDHDPDRDRRTDALYEVSLSIPRDAPPAETARAALSAYRRELGCAAGAVFERRPPGDDAGPVPGDEVGALAGDDDREGGGDGDRDEGAGATATDGEHRVRRLAAVPSPPPGDGTYRTAVDALRALDGAPADSLPRTVEADGGTAHLLPLPAFGVLVLVGPDPPLSAATVEAMAPLNHRLAEACRAGRTERRLRAERDRYRAAFDAVPEPLVDVAVEDGRAVVRAANRAFESAFGHDREDRSVRGRPLSELVTPEDGDDTGPDPADGRAADGWSVGDWATAEGGVERAVRRRTPDGVRTFALRSAPVAGGPPRRRVGLYVDVTDRRERERTLERLYRAARDFLDPEEPTAVCERAAEAAAAVLDFGATAVHRYDRTSGALVPVAAVGTDAPPAEVDPDPGNPVWEAYRSGEPTVLDAADARRLAGAGDAQGAMAFPLGGHGVLVAAAAGGGPGSEAGRGSDADAGRGAGPGGGGEGAGAFDGSDRYFGRLLATMLRTALDRVGRERSLRAVQETTARLVAAADVDEVTDLLADRAAEAFDLPIVGVWRADRPGGVLRPVARSSRAERLFGDLPTFEPEGSIAWTAFDEGTPRLVEDVAAHPGAYNPDTVLGSEMIAPLGEFGVVCAGSTLPDDFSPVEFEMFRTLATGAESAIRIVRQREELDVLDGMLARVLRHNIRNDLTAIRGFGTAIAEDCPDCAGDAREILAVSEDLLSTAEHARTVREVVDRRNRRVTHDLSSLVPEAVAPVREAFPDAEVVLDGGFDRRLRAHPDLDRAITHAVENAVEHADDPAPTVRLGARECVAAPGDDPRRGSDAGEAFAIEVIDDGPGIPESELAPIRAGEETDLNHGSGLGLWIVDRTVAYSGGTVRFETDDGGTTVSMRFDRSALVE